MPAKIPFNRIVEAADPTPYRGSTA